jgi:hypothetical protein
VICPYDLKVLLVSRGEKKKTGCPRSTLTDEHGKEMQHISKLKTSETESRETNFRNSAHQTRRTEADVWIASVASFRRV